MYMYLTHGLLVNARLLYGRLQRLGSHESSRTGGSSRQGSVLRFLGSCEEGEMVEFMKLLTLPFQDLTSELYTPTYVVVTWDL